MKKTLRAGAIAKALEREVPRYVEPAVGKADVSGNDPFKVLIAAVLSARTRDTVTEVAARRLFARAGTPEKLRALSEQETRRLIRPVGMWPTKARWLRQIPRLLLKEHGGRVPNTLDALLALPGVGRKVANLVLGVAFHQPAICVDTHVHRISNRLGLVRTRAPEETERALERILPKNLWVRWNALLVTWGQNVCVPIRPRCSQCVLRACPKSPSVIARSRCDEAIPSCIRRDRHARPAASLAKTDFSDRLSGNGSSVHRWA